MVRTRSMCWHSAVIFFVCTPLVVNCEKGKICNVIADIIARVCNFKNEDVDTCTQEAFFLWIRKKM